MQDRLLGRDGVFSEFLERYVATWEKGARVKERLGPPTWKECQEERDPPDYRRRRTMGERSANSGEPEDLSSKVAQRGGQFPVRSCAVLKKVIN